MTLMHLRVPTQKHTKGQTLNFVRELPTNTQKPWLPPADKDSGHHDGPTSILSTSMSSSNHGRQPSRLVPSQSKRLSIGGPSMQCLFLTPLAFDIIQSDESSYFYVIGQFLPNQAYQSIICGIAGGDGDFQVQGGSRSWFIVKIILQRDVIPAAEYGETVCINIYANIY